LGQLLWTCPYSTVPGLRRPRLHAQATLRARTRRPRRGQRDGRDSGTRGLGLRGTTSGPHRSGVAAVFTGSNLVLGTGYAKTFVYQVSPDNATWTDAASMDNSAVPLPFNNATPACRSRTSLPRPPATSASPCGVRNTSWGNSCGPRRHPTAPPRTDLALHREDDRLHRGSRPPGRARHRRRSGTRWSRSTRTTSGSRFRPGSLEELRPHRHPVGAGLPKTYVIQVSDDADTWTDVKPVSNTPDR